jgi:type IV secretory pathway VirB9-like protein
MNSHSRIFRIQGSRLIKFGLTACFFCLGLVIGNILLSCGSAFAQTPSSITQTGNSTGTPIGKTVTPKRVALDNRVVVFPFDENGIYEIKTMLERFTRISFAPDELVKAFYLSDTARWSWHISADKRNVLIKPHESGLSTTATLQTSIRTYDLDISSSDMGQVWHQRVSWDSMSNLGRGIFEDDEVRSTSGNRNNSNPLTASIDSFEKGSSIASKSPNLNARPADWVDPSILSDLPCSSRSMAAARLNYEATGEESFKPKLMFDDGEFTCLKMPDAMVDLPSLFVLSANGTADIVDHIYRDGWLIVPKVMTHGGLLVLGEQKVTITNKTADCGWFGRNCKASNINGQNSSGVN